MKNKETGFDTSNKFKKTEIGWIPENWEVKRLGEEIELCYGKRLIGDKRVSGNVPVYGANGIIGYTNKALVKGPGIIIGRKGSVGEVRFSKTDFWPIDTTYYVKLKSKGDITFWFYFLSNINLTQLSSHSAVPGLNREQVYQIKKGIPPLREQHTIAKVLSDMDSEIEAVQAKMDKLKQIKQGMMQVLLTGNKTY